MNLRRIFEKIPKEVWYLFVLFISTRVVLTIIGVVSRILLEPFHGKEYVWVYSKYLWLDIWGVWDSGWYLGISADWYSAPFDPITQSVWGFFPLYPGLMRLLGKIISDNYIAGIIISNICLIAAAIYLYKLVSLESDSPTALRSVKYMFLFPTAFVLSGVFTESLFLFLLIACFYYAKKKDWWKAGIAGFFLSLTRFWGVFVILPLLYEYLKARNFEIKRIRKDALWLLLVPLGLVLFSFYGYYKIGAYFSYWAVQSKAWGHMFTNPVAVLVNGTAISDVASLFGVFLAIAVLLLLFVFRKKTDFSYWLFALFLIMAPLLANPNFTALPRYALVAFASFIILAKLGKNNNLDSILTIILSLLQGFLMVLFANGFKII